MPRVIVCDVNETLLDVGALEPHFKQTFGDGRVLQDWFANVLLYSEVATLAGPYSDFASIRMISSLKLEYVVRPPMHPIVTAARRVGDQPSVKAACINAAMTKHPNRLTMRVP